MAKNPEVLVILGSKSDEETMAGCLAVLNKFKIDYSYKISSAHRNPEKTKLLAETAREKGYKVIIAAAGMAAALPGVLASYTTLPVIGVPLPSSALNGVDALYAIAQMPAGVPVASMAIGSHGAKNAALMAARIISLNDYGLAKKLGKYQKDLAKG